MNEEKIESLLTSASLVTIVKIQFSISIISDSFDFIFLLCGRNYYTTTRFEENKEKKNFTRPCTECV